MATFQLPVIHGQTYTKLVVIMDSIRYENCRFIDCQLVYKGGPGEASACYFSPGTVWQFEEPASTVVQTLQRYGFRLSFGSEGGEEPIRFPSDAM